MGGKKKWHLVLFGCCFFASKQAEVQIGETVPTSEIPYWETMNKYLERLDTRLFLLNKNTINGMINKAF